MSDAYGEVPSIEDLKIYQTLHGLYGVHVVWMNEEEFVIAHTDEERASGMDLKTCEVHCWMFSLEYPFDYPGLYVVHAPEVWRAV